MVIILLYGQKNGGTGSRTKLLKPSQFLNGTELEIKVSYSAFFSNIPYERQAILLGEREKVIPIGIFITNEI